jgi:hypothetical protein
MFCVGSDYHEIGVVSQVEAVIALTLVLALQSPNLQFMGNYTSNEHLTVHKYHTTKHSHPLSVIHDLSIPLNENTESMRPNHQVLSMPLYHFPFMPPLPISAS